MRRRYGLGIFLSAAAALLAATLSGSAARAGNSPSGSPPDSRDTENGNGVNGGIVSGVWQHHKATFDYVGFTTLFTCDGLEGRVQQILLDLGARRGVKVFARGCPGPYNTPTHTAWVDADFYTLAPASGAGAPDTVRARWTALEVTPRHPYYMSDGDCELMQGMKGLITENFTLRGVEYRTDCVPHEVITDSFAIRGQALRAAPQKLNAITGRPTTGRPVTS